MQTLSPDVMAQLRNHANQLAISQHVDIDGDYTRQEAYDELTTLGADEEPHRFIPSGHYETVDMATLRASVDKASDAILDAFVDVFQLVLLDTPAPTLVSASTALSLPNVVPLVGMFDLGIKIKHLPEGHDLGNVVAEADYSITHDLISHTELTDADHDTGIITVTCYLKAETDAAGIHKIVEDLDWQLYQFTYNDEILVTEIRDVTHSEDGHSTSLLQADGSGEGKCSTPQFVEVTTGKKERKPDMCSMWKVWPIRFLFDE